MRQFIDTFGLADDICGEMPDPWETQPNRMIEGVEKAVNEVVAMRLTDRPPKITDLVAFTDSAGQELAAALSAAPYLDRSTFFRALVGALSKDALADLHSELMRG